MSHFKQFGRAAAANGYHVIPVRRADKMPGFPGAGKDDLLRGWDKFCDTPADDATLDAWAQYDCGVGIACGKVVVIDIDIVTSPELAADYERRVLEIIGVPDAPTRTGRYPKRALFFRAAEAIASRSRKFKGTFGKDGVDILAHGRQVVAYGIHPETMREYVWRDGSPAMTPVDALPAITQAMCDQILALEPDAAATPSQTPAQALPTPSPAGATAQTVGNATPHDVTSIKWLVDNLPNTETTTWDEWVKTGFAIYEATRDTPDAGRILFHSWSAKNPAKHDARKTDRKWSSIARDSRGTVGIGTLIKHVRAAGIQIPSSVQFDDTGDLPEVDLSEYAERLAKIPITADEQAAGLALVSAYEYAIWLYYIDNSSDEVGGGRLARLHSRCPGMEAPIDVAADEVERVRLRIGQALAVAQTEDVESIIEPSVSNEEHRARHKNWSGILDGDDVDNPVRLNDQINVLMTPSLKPAAPAAVRWAPPGVIAEFSAWTTRTAPTRVREFSVMAGVSLVATIIGRAVKSPTGVRPNLYILNVAPSSSGKNHALGCLKRSLSSVGILSRHILGSNVTSSAAIRNAFERAAGDKKARDFPDAPQPDGTAMSKLFLSDEIGSFWQSNGASNAHAAGVMGDLLSFFSAAGEIMPGTAMAAKSAGELPYPHLNLLGCSAQGALFDSMTREQLTQGHVNRFLLVEPSEIVYRDIASKVAYWSGRTGGHDVPAGVSATVHALSRWCNERMGLGGDPWEDYADELPFTADAAAFVAHVDELKDMCARHASMHSGVVFEPFGRMAEMTVRLALVSAMSRLTEKLRDDADGKPRVVGTPIVELVDCQWGFEIARYSAMRFAYVMKTKDVADDVQLRGPLSDKVIKLVARHKRGIRQREVQKQLHVSKDAMNKVLTELVDSRALATYRKIRDRNDTKRLITSDNLAELMASEADMSVVVDASWMAATA